MVDAMVVVRQTLVLLAIIAAFAGCGADEPKRMFSAKWRVEISRGPETELCKLYVEETGRTYLPGEDIILYRTAADWRSIAPAFLKMTCDGVRYQVKIVSGCGELCEGHLRRECDSDALVAEDWQISLTLQVPQWGSFIECTTDTIPTGFASTSSPIVSVVRL
jgi:hypothetical protein